MKANKVVASILETVGTVGTVGTLAILSFSLSEARAQDSETGSGPSVELLSGAFVPVSYPSWSTPQTSFTYGLGVKYRINHKFRIGARWLNSKVYSTSGSYDLWIIRGSYSINQTVSAYAVTFEYSPMTNLYVGTLFGLSNLNTEVEGSGSITGVGAGSLGGHILGAYVGYDIPIVKGLKFSPQVNFTHLPFSVGNFNAVGLLASVKYDF